MSNVFTYEGGGIKPWVSYAVIGLAVVGGGLLVYRAWAGSGTPKAAMMCVSPGCGYTTNRTPQPEDSIPAPCPKCEKETLYPAVGCTKCGTPFVWNENRGLPPPTKCPKCGLEMRHGG